jgi:hypothetical protein
MVAQRTAVLTTLAVDGHADRRRNQDRTLSRGFHRTRAMSSARPAANIAAAIYLLRSGLIAICGSRRCRTDFPAGIPLSLG